MNLTVTFTRSNPSTPFFGTDQDSSSSNKSDHEVLNAFMSTTFGSRWTESITDNTGTIIVSDITSEEIEWMNTNLNNSKSALHSAHQRFMDYCTTNHIDIVATFA
ncbi:hypothetical protein UFOVP257_291 [uncultured Caudovirales phage]|uniref:Uncharacterized protein n=1 Tax=uncultured Caudovirales phage TaxID=2100421 RepID=A0A6J5LPA8_9CAUD|nr:hypothetical protein UFOVP257_291 [uncultured Caudovirales phage]